MTISPFFHEKPQCPSYGLCFIIYSRFILETMTLDGKTACFEGIDKLQCRRTAVTVTYTRMKNLNSSVEKRRLRTTRVTWFFSEPSYTSNKWANFCDH